MTTIPFIYLLTYYVGDSQTHQPNVNYCVLPKRHREPRNEVVSLNPIAYARALERTTFQFQF